MKKATCTALAHLLKVKVTMVRVRTVVKRTPVVALQVHTPLAVKVVAATPKVASTVLMMLVIMANITKVLFTPKYKFVLTNTLFC